MKGSLLLLWSIAILVAEVVKWYAVKEIVRVFLRH